MTRDSSARTQAAERAFRESEARYQDLVENSHDLICTHDLGGTILSLNERPARLLGYRPEELVGCSIPDHLFPGHRDEYMTYIERIKRDGVASGLMALITKSGERRVWEYRNTLRTQGVPEPLVRGIAHDVTEERKAQKASRESTARLQAVLNSIDEIAFEFDVDGTFLDIWTTNENLLFRPRDQLLGRSVSDVIGKDFATKYHTVFRRVLETGRGENLEYPMQLVDGECWFLCRVTPIADRDGTYKSLCMLARNITERKKNEKSLNLFRALLDRSTDGIEVADPTTLRVLDVNQRACADLGYTREELLQMTLYDIDPNLTAEIHGKAHQKLKRFGCLIMEVDRRRKDGTTFPAEISLSLAQLDRDYFVGIVRDITERKASEHALRNLSGLLLRAQDEERRRLARDLHDGIGMYVSGLSLALGKLRGFLDERDPNHRRVIAESRELIRAAGEEIRSLSYLLHPPTLEQLGLKSALSWLVKGFSQRSDLRISLDAPPRIGRFAPEVELTLFRVTQEALNNVLRHSKSRSASVTLMRKSDTIVLEVADRGIGIEISGKSPRFTVGISGMEERVTNLGGSFSIKSVHRVGCVVRAMLPAKGRRLLTHST